MHSKSKIRLIAVTLMMIIFTSTVFSVNVLAKEYLVIDEGKNQVVTILSNDTQKILDKAGVTLGSDDVAVKNDVDSTVTVKRAFEVSIYVDGLTLVGTYVDGTVGSALKNFNVKLDANDKVNPGLTEPLTPDLKITVTRYHEIEVKDNTTTEIVSVPYGTVKNALEYLNITLGAEDIINVPLNSQVTEGMTISISRVGYHEQTVSESIPYATDSVQTDTLPLGVTKIKTAGVTGQSVKTILQKYVNGQLVESTEKNKIITVQPIDEVILVGTGTNSSQSTSSTPSIPSFTTSSQSSSSSSDTSTSAGTFRDQDGKIVEYKSVITGTATAYTAEEGAITSTGRVAQRGYVAVDPSVIPYGTSMYIVSPDGTLVYGYALAADTGGAMLNGEALVDLYYDTEEECWQFGRRQMTIYIL